MIIQVESQEANKENDSKKEYTEIQLSSANFDKEVIESKLPVVVDFYADWCGPCKRFSPIFEEFGENNVEKISTGRVNITNESELATKYNVTSIPTLIFFKDGVEIGRSSGFMTLEKLEDTANTYFSISDTAAEVTTSTTNE